MEDGGDGGCWVEGVVCWVEDEYLSKDRNVSLLMSESTRVTTSRREGKKPTRCWKIFLWVNKHMPCCSSLKGLKKHFRKYLMQIGT